MSAERATLVIRTLKMEMLSIATIVWSGLAKCASGYYSQSSDELSSDGCVFQWVPEAHKMNIAGLQISYSATFTLRMGFNIPDFTRK